jgi:hypothetical protein
MLALTIAQPKPLSSELNTEGLLSLGFLAEWLIKGKHLYIENCPCILLPLIHYTTNNITKCTSY